MAYWIPFLLRIYSTATKKITNPNNTVRMTTMIGININSTVENP